MHLVPFVLGGGKWKTIITQRNKSFSSGFFIQKVCLSGSNIDITGTSRSFGRHW